jgi:mono/diheme cytochrome c family protein
VHRKLLETSFGLNVENGKPIGLFSIQEQGFSMGAFGCVACHSGKAAGRIYIGLGNKNVDVGTIGRTIMRFEKPYRWARHVHSPAKREVIDRAFEFARKLVHPRVTNLTKGLVSINTIHLWFYEQGHKPLPMDMPRGGTKVPPLWGIKEKAVEAGLFYDGLGKAKSIGWLILPELTAGQLPENIRSDWPRVERLWELITKFEPPAYPFAIDRVQAARGKVFYDQACLKCHGAHERTPAGKPVYLPPLFNTLDEVDTDADRLAATNSELLSLIAKSPLADLVEAGTRPRGYFAMRMDATWASFPYLHNASVPTLWDLLEKPAARPRFWSLERTGDADRFDAKRVGLTVPPPGSREARKLERRARRGDRDVYWVERDGHSNKGHDFGTDLSDADKAALVEYLKTL